MWQTYDACYLFLFVLTVLLNVGHCEIDRSLVKTTGWILRDYKYFAFDKDPRQSSADSGNKKFASEFPTPKVDPLDRDVERKCNSGLEPCLKYIHSVAEQTPKYQYINGKLSRQQRRRLKRKFDYKPFRSLEEYFNFVVTASYYMCQFTLQKQSELQHFGAECPPVHIGRRGHAIKNDYRQSDKQPFECAMLSFCPDPCYGSIGSGIIPREGDVLKDKSNPCQGVGDGHCMVEAPESPGLPNIMQNILTPKCNLPEAEEESITSESNTDKSKEPESEVNEFEESKPSIEEQEPDSTVEEQELELQTSVKEQKSGSSMEEIEPEPFKVEKKESSELVEESKPEPKRNEIKEPEPKIENKCPDHGTTWNDQYSTCLNPNDDSLLKATIIDVAWYLRVWKFFRRDPRPDGHQDKNFASSFPDISGLGLYSPVKSACEQSFQHCVLEIAEAVQQSAMFQYQNGHISPTEKKNLGENFYIKPFKTELEAFAHYITATYYMCQFTLSKRPVLEHFGGSLGKCEAVNMASNKVVQDFREVDDIPFQCAMFSFCPDPCFGSIGSGLISKKTTALSNSLNPCHGAGKGDCIINIPDAPTWQDVAQSRLKAYCPFCGDHGIDWGYGKCIDPKKDDSVKPIMRNAAWYLRGRKFFGSNPLPGGNANKNFASSFPDISPVGFDPAVKAACEKGFQQCVLEIAQTATKTAIFRYQGGKISDNEKKRMGDSFYYEPFNKIGAIKFIMTASYYMCNFTLAKHPSLEYFGGSWKRCEAVDISTYRVLDDFRDHDNKPYQCALFSFCPDPCYGSIGSGLIQKESTALTHSSNPCNGMGNGACKVDMPKNPSVVQIQQNKVNPQCSCGRSKTWLAKYRRCLDLNDDEAIKPFMRNAAWYLRTRKFFGNDPRPGYRGKNFAARFPDITKIGLDPPVRTACEESFQMCALEIANTAARTSIFQYQSGKISNSEKDRMGDAFYYRPFKDEMEAFRFFMTASFYMCQFTLKRLPALEYFGGSWKRCEAVDISVHRVGDDFRDHDNKPYQCAMFSFCPDPCYGLVNSGLVPEKSTALRHASNPCQGIDAGDCTVEIPKDVTLNAIPNVNPMCGDCTYPTQKWNPKYRLCLDPSNEDQVKPIMRNVAWYLRNQKFFSRDPRLGMDNGKNFAANFPDISETGLYAEVQEACERGFTYCVLEIAQKAATTALFQYQSGKISDGEKKELGEAFYYMPFNDALEAFNFTITASYYMCHFTLNKRPVLEYFGGSWGKCEAVNMTSYRVVEDFRQPDNQPFQCAMFSFCPDPCYGPIGSGLLAKKSDAFRHKDNPCRKAGTGECKVEIPNKPSLTDVQQNPLDVKCGSCENPQEVWNPKYRVCLDPNDEDSVKPVMRNAAWYLRMIKFFAKDPRPDGSTDKNFAAHFPDIRNIGLDPEVKSACEESFQFCVLEIAQTAQKTAIFQYQAQEISDNEKQELGDAFYYKPFKNELEAFKFAITASYYMCHFTLSKRPVLEYFGGSWGKCEAVNMTSYRAIHDFREIDDKPYQCAMFSFCPDPCYGPVGSGLMAKKSDAFQHKDNPCRKAGTGECKVEIPDNPSIEDIQQNHMTAKCGSCANPEEIWNSKYRVCLDPNDEDSVKPVMRNAAWYLRMRKFFSKDPRPEQRQNNIAASFPDISKIGLDPSVKSACEESFQYCVLEIAQTAQKTAIFQYQAQEISDNEKQELGDAFYYKPFKNELEAFKFAITGSYYMCHFTLSKRPVLEYFGGSWGKCEAVNMTSYRAIHDFREIDDKPYQCAMFSFCPDPCYGPVGSGLMAQKTDAFNDKDNPCRNAGTGECTVEIPSNPTIEDVQRNPLIAKCGSCAKPEEIWNSKYRVCLDPNDEDSVKPVMRNAAWYLRMRKFFSKDPRRNGHREKNFAASFPDIRNIGLDQAVTKACKESFQYCVLEIAQTAQKTAIFQYQAKEITEDEKQELGDAFYYKPFKNELEAFKFAITSSYYMCQFTLSKRPVLEYFGGSWGKCEAVNMTSYRVVEDFRQIDDQPFQCAMFSFCPDPCYGPIDFGLMAKKTNAFTHKDNPCRNAGTGECKVDIPENPTIKDIRKKRITAKCGTCAKPEQVYDTKYRTCLDPNNDDLVKPIMRNAAWYLRNIKFFGKDPRPDGNPEKNFAASFPDISKLGLDPSVKSACEGSFQYCVLEIAQTAQKTAIFQYQAQEITDSEKQELGDAYYYEPFKDELEAFKFAITSSYYMCQFTLAKRPVLEYFGGSWGKCEAVNLTSHRAVNDFREIDDKPFQCAMFSFCADPCYGPISSGLMSKKTDAFNHKDNPCRNAGTGECKVEFPDNPTMEDIQQNHFAAKCGSCAKPEQIYDTKYRACLDPNNDDLVKPVMRNTAWYLRNMKFFSKDPRPEGNPEKNFASTFPDISEIGLDPSVKSACEESFQYCVLEIAQTAQKTAIFQYQANEISDSEKRGLADAFFYSPFKDELEAFKFAITSSYYMCQFTLAKRPVLEYFGGSWGKCEAVNMTTYRAVEDFREIDDKPFQCAMFSFCPDPCYGPIGSGLMAKKTDAFTHRDNPCRNAGTGECKVELPENPTMKDIKKNHFTAKCGSCAQPAQRYDPKYRACLDPKNDDLVKPIIRNAAWYLRNIKFFGRDPRPDGNPEKNFAASFPDISKIGLDLSVKSACKESFQYCVLEIAQTAQKTAIFQYQAQEISDSDKLELGDEFYYKPFKDELEAFKFAMTASYYMCQFTLSERPVLEYFGGSWGKCEAVNLTSHRAVIDFREIDDKPFQCAMFSFCPDPCYGPITSGLMAKKTDAFNHKDNPCRNAGTGECKVEIPKNPTLEDIQQNRLTAKCGSCAEPEQKYDSKYRTCLDPKNDDLLKPIMRNAAWYLRNIKFFGIDPRPDGNHEKNFASSFPDISKIGLDPAVKSACEKSFQYCVLEIAQTAQKTAIFQYQAQEITDSEKQELGYSFYYKPFKNSLEAFKFAMTASYYMCQFTLSKRPVLEYFGGSWGKCEAVNMTSYKAVEDFREIDDKPYQCAMFSFCPDPCYGTIDSGLMPKMQYALKHKDNPCRNAGTGECKIEIPKNPTLKDIQQNRLTAKCGSCAEPGQIYDTKYRACLDPKNDDLVKPIMRNAAWYLRNRKFFSRDPRPDGIPDKNFAASFPDISKIGLDPSVKSACEESFQYCALEIAQTAQKTAIFQYQAQEITDKEKQQLGDAFYYEPFKNEFEAFKFVITASYYMCQFTLSKRPVLEYFGGSWGKCEAVNMTSYRVVHDYREIDDKPFQCAMFSFCPDPCYGPIGSGLMSNKDYAFKHKDNPCRNAGTGECKVEIPKNPTIKDIQQNHLTAKCGSCAEPQQIYDTKYRVCLDPNNDDFVKPIMRNAAWYLRNIKFFGRDPRPDGNHEKNFAASFPDISKLGLDQSVKSACEESFQYCVLEIAQTAQKTAIFEYQAQEISDSEKQELGDAFYYKPFKNQFEAFKFAMTASYYMCQFTLSKRPVLEYFGGSWGKCEAVNMTSYRVVEDFRQVDDKPFQCSMFSFCPDPCYGSIDSGLMPAKGYAYKNKDNPCRNAGKGKCEIEVPENPTIEDIQQNRLTAKCGSCEKLEQIYDKKYRACLDPKNDDLVKPIMRNAAWYLRNRKFFGRDPRPDGYREKNFAASFPDISKIGLDPSVKSACEESFQYCVLEIAQTAQKTAIFQYQAQEITDSKKKELGNAFYYKPFTNELEAFKFAMTASYYMCHFTLNKRPVMEYFGGSWGRCEAVNMTSYKVVVDFREIDDKPFQCAMFSFCPDPCYGPIDSGLMSKKNYAIKHKDNPCRNAGTGECKVEIPENPTMEDIQQSHLTAKCGSCAEPEQIYNTKYRACLDPKNDDLVKPVMRNAAWYLRTRKFFGRDPRPDGKPGKNFATTFPDISQIGLDHSVKSACEESFQYCVLEIAQTAQKTAIFQYQAQEITDSEKQELGNAFYYKPFENEVAAFKFVMTASYYLCHFTLSKRPVLEYFGGSWGRCEAVNMTSYRVVEDFRELDDKPFQCAMFSFCPDPCYGPIDSGLMQSKKYALKHKDNPCRNAGTGECKIEIPENPNIEDSQQNRLTAKCGSCEQPEQIYDTKYRACLDPNNDDLVKPVMRNAGWYLRTRKFFSKDPRPDGDPQKNFAASFPDISKLGLDQTVKSACEESFQYCVLEIAQTAQKTAIFQYQTQEITDSKKKELGDAFYYKPFENELEAFKFIMTASYYLCHFTLSKRPVLEYFGGSWGRCEAVDMTAYRVVPDFRELDDKPFQCAMFSFCPDPCYGPIDSGLLPEKTFALKHPDNPCRNAGTGECKIEIPENATIKDIQQNRLTAKCGSCPEEGHVYDAKYRLCLDPTDEDSLKPIMRNAAWYLRGRKFFGRDPRPEGNPEKNFAASFPDISDISLDQSVKSACEESFQYCVLEIARTAQKTAIFDYQAGKITDSDKQELGDAFYYKPFKNEMEAFKFAITASYYMCQFTLSKRPVLEYFGGSWGRCEAVDMTSYRVVPDFREFDDKPFQCAMFSFCPDPCFGPIGSGLLADKKEALKHVSNPCNSAGTGDCKVNIPANPTIEDIQHNLLEAKCRSCENPKETWNSKYRICFDSENEDSLKPTIRNAAWYLRGRKFFGRDPRPGETPQKNFAASFPDTSQTGLDPVVKSTCEESFHLCVLEIAQTAQKTAIFEYQEGKISNEDKNQLGNAFYYKPFQNELEAFTFYITASLYMCKFTLARRPVLEYFGGSWGKCEAVDITAYAVVRDFREDDDKPFQCALFSFCPDPCYGTIGSGLLDDQYSPLVKEPVNPCHEIDDGDCAIEFPESPSLDFVQNNQLTVKCGICSAHGAEWSKEYDFCIDPNNDGALKPIIRNAAWYLRNRKFFARDPRQNTNDETYAASFPHIPLDDVDASVQRACEQGFQHCVLHIAQRATKTAIFHYQTGKVSEEEKAKLGDLFYYKPFKSEVHAFTFAVTASYYMCQYTLAKRPVLEFFRGSWKKCEAVNITSYRAIDDFRQTDDKPFQCALFSFCPDPCYGTIGSGLIADKSFALQQPENPCKSVGMGECSVEGLENPTLEDVMENKIYAKCMCDDPEAMWIAKYQTCLDPNNDETLKPVIRNTAWYLRNHKFFGRDPRPDGNPYQNFASGFPNIVQTGLDHDVEKACKEGFQTCVLEIGQKATKTSIFEYQSGKVTDEEKQQLGDAFYYKPFKNRIKAFEFAITASYYMCQFTLKKRPVLEHFGGTRKRCEAVDIMSNTIVDDFRDFDTSSFQCAMYSFCPDPCYGLVGTGLIKEQQKALSSPFNGCHHLGTGVCSLDFPETTSLENVIDNKIDVICTCDEPPMAWNKTYHLCLKPGRILVDDKLIQSVGEYLSFHKFFGSDPRSFSSHAKNLASRFPRPRIHILNPNLEKACSHGLQFCLLKIEEIAKDSPLFQYIRGEVEWTSGAKDDDSFYYKPFGNKVEFFRFIATVRYYLCLFALRKDPRLEHFGAPCPAEDLTGDRPRRVDDFRATDVQPYGCALFSFCPDPCYGSVNSGLIADETTAWKDKSNRCHGMGTGECTLEIPKDLEDITDVRDVKLYHRCQCPDGAKWSTRYHTCLDPNNDDIVKPFMKDVAWFLRAFKFSDRADPRSYGTGQKNFAADFPIPKISTLDPSIKKACEQSFQICILEIAHLAGRTAVMGYQGKDISEIEKLHLGQRFFYLPFKDRYQAFRFVISASYYMCQFTYMKHDGLTTFGGSWKKCEVLDLNSFQYQHDFREEDTAPYQCALFSFCPDPCYGAIGSGLFEKKSQAISNPLNPCYQTGDGECTVLFPKVSDFEVIRENHINMTCPCEDGTQWNVDKNLCLDPTKTSPPGVTETMIREIGWYMRVNKFFEQDPRKESETKNQTSSFPMPKIQTLEKNLEKSCQHGLDYCMLRIHQTIQTSKLRKYHVGKLSWEEGSKLGENFFYQPFSDPIQKFTFAATARYYLCLFALRKDPQLEQFGAPCPAEDLTGDRPRRVDDFRATDQQPYGCALFSFCPDPCYGSIGNGLFEKEKEAVKHELNPCRKGERECLVQFPSNPTLETLRAHQLNASCTCAVEGSTWSDKYKICINPNADESMKPIMRNAAWYLRNLKFFGADLRPGFGNDENFAARFPKVKEHPDVQKACTESFQTCVMEIAGKGSRSPIFDYQTSKITKSEMEAMGSSYYYKPFQDKSEAFRFLITSLSYMCQFTLNRHPLLEYFGGSWGRCEAVNVQTLIAQKDFREFDTKPYQCAMFSFCPDPCYGYVGNGLLDAKDIAFSHELNPCHHYGTGECSVAIPKNISVADIMQQKMKVQCQCERPNTKWNLNNQMCLDPEAGASVDQGTFRRIAWYLAGNKFFGKKADGTTRAKNFAAGFPNLKVLDPQLEATCERGYEYCLLKIYHTAKRSAAFDYMFGRISWQDRVEMGDAFLYKPFQNMDQHIRFTVTASYYLCLYTLKKEPRLEKFGAACDVVDFSGEVLKRVEDFRSFDNEHFDCAILSFCPDPCFGNIDSGLIVEKTAVLKHESNPCHLTTTGECVIDVDKSLTVESIRNNDLKGRCECDDGTQWIEKYRVCLDIEDDDQIKPVMRNVAWFLRAQKFYGHDIRFPDQPKKNFAAGFPQPPVEEMNDHITEACEEGFQYCVLEIEKWTSQSPIFDYVRGKITKEEMLEMGEDFYVLPFADQSEAFEFMVSASYFMCWYTLMKTKTLEYFGGSWGKCDIVDLATFEQLDDFRIHDKEPFQCALLSFCPDPCYGSIGSGTITDEATALSSSFNPCQKYTTKECEIDLHEMPDFVALQESRLNYTCACDEAQQEGYEWNHYFKKCVDINECQRATYACGDNEACKNTVGSYACVCKAGYRPDSETQACYMDMEELEGEQEGGMYAAAQQGRHGKGKDAEEEEEEQGGIMAFFKEYGSDPMKFFSSSTRVSVDIVSLILSVLIVVFI